MSDEFLAYVAAAECDERFKADPGTPHALWKRGKEAWPAIALSIPDWCAHASLHAEALLLAAESGRCYAEDFYLAAACLYNVDGARETLARDYLADLSAAFHRLRMSEDAKADVAQNARTAILIGDRDRPSKLRSYSGKGPLPAWIRVLVSRLALTSLTSTPQSFEEPSADLPNDETDPIVAQLRRTHQAAFRAAAAAAMASLDVQERNLLRMHHMEGLTVDELAVILGVHRATAARQVVRVRELLFERTKETLLRELQISPTEFASIARALVLELDISVHRLLNDPSKP